MTFKSNIDINNRGLNYADSGDDSWDGRTIETAKKTIQSAIDATQDLIPPPSLSAIATVTEAQGGVFFEDLKLYDSVLFEGRQSTIISSGPIGVECDSNLSFNPQTIINNGVNATAILCDGISSFGCVFSSLVVGGDNSKGVEITGNNDDLFFSISQIRIVGVGSKGVEFTGQVNTPVDFNFNVVSFSADNEIFFHYNPSGGASRADVSVSSVFIGLTIPSNTTAFLVESGIVKARAGSVEATTVADVTDSVFTMSCNVIAGKTIARAGASIIYDTVGFINGDLETVGDGTLQVRSSIITGNATNAGGMSIKCDSFMGEIVNTGTMYVQIDNYTGTMPANDGSINGIINGVRFGNWRPEFYQLSNQVPAISILDYDSFPTFYINQPQTLRGGDYMITWSASIGVSATNRRCAVGCLIDGVVQFDPADIEPKDANNDYYISKTIKVNLTAGSHDFQMDFGRRGGTGSAQALIRDGFIVIRGI